MGIPGCCDEVFDIKYYPFLCSILGFAIVTGYLQAREEYNTDNRT